MQWQLNHRHLLDLDGAVNAWSGLFWKLYSNSLVVKITSVWEQWYYDQLEPNVHYVAVDSLSEIGTALNSMCGAGRQQPCQVIAARGKAFVESLTYEYALTKYKIR